MKYGFTLKNIDIKTADEEIAVGEVSFQVDDLNLKEYLDVMIATPDIARNFLHVIKEAKDLFEEDTVQYPSAADIFKAAVQTAQSSDEPNIDEDLDDEDDDAPRVRKPNRPITSEIRSSK